MLTLSLPARSGTVVRDVALPTMYDLLKAVNEIVTLAVLDGIEIVTIAIAEIPEKIVFSTLIGQRQPAYCTAAGKMLLACQPVETWDRLLSRIEFVSYTDKTIVDRELLREELLIARQQGYATQDGELLVSLGSMAAPIIDYHNDVVAAINISGLSVQMFDENQVDRYTGEVKQRTTYPNIWVISRKNLAYRVG
jgi:DNA-binding IclR family transcriptional regulator